MPYHPLLPRLALALAGCGAATSSLPIQRPVVADAGPEFRRAVDTLGQAEAVPGTLDRVWQALRAVYQELGLRANEVDPRARRVGVRAQRLTRDAGGTRLSVYLDCGSGLTGPHADEYRVTLTAISTVVPGQAHRGHSGPGGGSGPFGERQRPDRVHHHRPPGVGHSYPAQAEAGGRALSP